MANDGVALAGIGLAGHGPGPVFAKDGEGVGTDGLREMVGPVKDELHAGGNHAKLADYEPIAGEVEEVTYVALKILNRFEIIIVRILSHLDLRVGDDIAQEAEPLVASERENGSRRNNRHAGRILGSKQRNKKPLM